MAKPTYEVCQMATTFTAFCPYPDTVELRTQSYDKALEYFNNTCGTYALVEVYKGRRTVIQRSLI